MMYGDYKDDCEEHIEAMELAELDETWETHSFTGKRHGEVRGKCVNTDEPDSYSADLESVYGTKFRSPIKAIHANSQKAKQRANTTI